MPLMILSILTNKYVLMAILIGVVVAGLYGKGRLDAQHAQQLAAARAEIAAMQRDRDIAQKAEAIATEKAAELTADAIERDKEIAAYAEELKKRPDRCDLTPADIDRLRIKPGKSK